MSNGDQPFSGSPLQEHDPSIEPGDILLPPLDFFNNINLVDDEEESAFVVPENFFSNINLIDEEDVVSSDFFSSINLVDEEPEEELPQKTKLTNYVPLSTIDQYDRFVEGDHKNMQSDPGVIERFARNFLEGLSPLPAGTLGVDFTEDIMPSEDLSDQVAGAVGQIAGFGVGLFATGGNNLEEIKFKQNITIRKTGSAALDLAYVAAGKFDGYFQKNLNIWDIASGIILVKEAGGIINDIDINKYEIEKVIASSSEINEKMIQNLINF